jgi:hypothetical protein
LHLLGALAFRAGKHLEGDALPLIQVLELDTTDRASVQKKHLQSVFV